MKAYWAIGAALLVAGPIMALPSGHQADPAPKTHRVVVNLDKVEAALNR